MSEEILKTAVRRHCRKTQSDPEDARSEANEIYARARKDFVPGRVAFAHFLRYRLARRLSDSRRKHVNRARLLKKVPLRNTHPAPPEWHWTDDLSQDAARVVQLVVMSRRGLDPRRVRAAVRRYLLAIGFSKWRVERTFQEISNALGNQP